MTADIPRLLARLVDATERQALMSRPCLQADEAAWALGISEDHLRDLVARGVLRRVPHTGRLLIATAELRRFAEGVAA